MPEALDEICAVVRPPLREALRRALESGEAEAWLELDARCRETSGAADALSQAAFAAKRARHASVEKLLAAALSLEPFHLEATLETARLWLGRGLPRQAVKLLLDLRADRLTRGEETPDFDALLLRAARAAQDAETARAAAWRLAGLRDAPWDDLLEAAAFFREDGDLDAQRMLFPKLLERRPESAAALRLMGSWLADEGYTDEAAAHLRRAAKASTDRSEGAEIQRMLLELVHPEDYSVFRELTEGFFRRDPRPAIPKLEALVKVHAGFAEAWLFLGFARRLAGLLPAAAEAFARAAEISDDPNAHKELGAILGSLGRPREAMRHSERALELLGGRDRVALVNLAAACLDAGQRNGATDAVARLREVDALHPALPELERRLKGGPRPARGFFVARGGGRS